MAKQTQMEKAIAGVDADIAILQATRARLVKQDEEQKAKKIRKTPGGLHTSVPSIDAEAHALVAEAHDMVTE